MISSLRGTVIKGNPGDVTVDVHGVGYRVSVPINLWDDLPDIKEAMLWITTYVREDRLDLFGFSDKATRAFFEKLTSISGIGPKTGLEICAVPRGLLGRAVAEDDAKVLQSVKGIGKKTAEKLLVELKALAEDHPQMFTDASGAQLAAKFDPDAIAALTQLGYAQQDILRVLDTLPRDLATTEERVSAALRSL
jgi:Holliday junction DNA helicase RuvA